MTRGGINAVMAVRMLRSKALHKQVLGGSLWEQTLCGVRSAVHLFIGVGLAEICRRQRFAEDPVEQQTVRLLRAKSKLGC